MTQPPTEKRQAPPRASWLRYQARIDALVAKYPDLSAVRVLEEIAKGEEGYRGSIGLVRRYLRRIRPARRTGVPGGVLRAGRGHAGGLGRLRTA